MSRLKRVAHSVASGYVVLGVTAIYALASLPLALHYLSKERFGLWGLMASISGHLSLIDAGMSGSVARLLIDYKDQREGGTYGSLIKTGWLVLLVQGLIICSVGFGLAPLLCNLEDIQPQLRTEFIQLLRWQSIALAVQFCTRIFGHILQAHQRIDLINYSQVFTLVLNFTLLWTFFHYGNGVYSLAWGTLLSCLGGAVLSSIYCLRLHLFPPVHAWGKASWKQFREIFDYGKDMFLVAVGTQLIVASQVMIITPKLGLIVSGAWFAATRTFNLVSQAVWRLSDMAAPAFSEMIVRGERTLLHQRYQAVAMLSASVSAFAAVSFALCNSLFIRVYTEHSGRPIDWPPVNDMLLGTWMIVSAILHCHGGFLLCTKKIGFMRYVYFLEGLVFVGSALLTIQWGGLPALIICSIICSVVFSGAYTTWRISEYFQLEIREVAGRWLWPMGRVLLLFVPIAFVTWQLSKNISDPIIRLAVNFLVSISIGFFIFLRFGLPRATQKELLQRAPKGFNPFLRIVFLGATTQ